MIKISKIILTCGVMLVLALPEAQAVNQQNTKTPVANTGQQPAIVAQAAPHDAGAQANKRQEITAKYSQNVGMRKSYVKGTQEILKELVAGNTRFATNHCNPRNDEKISETLQTTQHPKVAWLTCADSRDPIEIITDASIGTDFANKVAGNVVDGVILGSFEYAVEHIKPGVQVLIVMGHTGCGAINAAIGDGYLPSNIGDLYEKIAPAIHEVTAKKLSDPSKPDYADVVCKQNVIIQMRHMIEKSAVLREKFKAGEIDIVGARYDLKTRKIEFLPADIYNEDIDKVLLAD